MYGKLSLIGHDHGNDIPSPFCQPEANRRFCLLSGEGIKQACEYKEARIVGIHLGVCLLQILGRRYCYLTVDRTKALRG